MIKQYDIEKGIYEIEYYSNKSVRTVIIDDYIPCIFQGMSPFISGMGCQIFPYLIIKLLAKLKGSY